MKNETVLSTGIDIGTTTTHLIVSRLGICETGGFGVVPSVEITSKEILYKSPVYFTPLLENGDIDLQGVALRIQKEYDRAGIAPSDLKCGAVIITGESARKGNAAKVLSAISENSGDFVAAEAGSELESYLSGKGAGADKLSEDTGKTVANIDIGGGTTNISVFKKGTCVDTCCLNIGGRTVKQGENGELYVTDAIKALLLESHIIITGFQKNKEDIICLCNTLADWIFAALQGTNKRFPQNLITDHLLTNEARPEIITFSGGVAECMGKALPDFAFGDIGVLLGKAVLEKAESQKIQVAKTSCDPIRATVIGASHFSTRLSGSTISYFNIDLPIKNLPCVCSLSQIGDTPCTFCPQREKTPSFREVNQMADDIVRASQNLIKNHIPLVVITKEDYSKALGQCIRRLLPKNYPLLCADSVSCKQGDYIDIGAPVAGGKVVPVIVKTLIFGG